MVFVETKTEIFGVEFFVNMDETELKVSDTVFHEEEKRSYRIVYEFPYE